MKAIGGYFELEIQKEKERFHRQPAFKSGRSALHFILKYTGAQNVYIPFFTCNGLLESFEAANVPFQFYEVNSNLEPVKLPELQAGDYFLYINYFGLKSRMVDTLIEKYKDKLIIDSSQAFFYKGDGRCWSFNSCRKFFGVPDGAYLYYPEGHTIQEPLEKNEDYTLQHLVQRLNGHIASGYPAFAENEILCNADLKGMSLLSEHLLSAVDYEACMQKRKQNFTFLHQQFQNNNVFKVDAAADAVPMVYPLLLNNEIKHEQLWQKNVFVPLYWADVVKRENKGFETEKYLSQKLLPLPVDHRYSLTDMQYMAQLINAL